MTDAERFKLIGGPYEPPAVRRGDTITCEARGREVQVGGMSDGRIQWPCALKTGRRSLILCGDLVEAVRRESEQAIAYWWGVSIVTVWSWRKAIGVPQVNEGTARLYDDYAPEKLTDEVGTAGRSLARSPEAIAKMAATKRGKPAHPATRAALLAAASAPKSETCKAAASARSIEQHRKRRGHGGAMSTNSNGA